MAQPYDLQSYYYSPQTQQLQNVLTAQKIEEAPLLMEKTRVETETAKVKLGAMMDDAKVEKEFQAEAALYMKDHPEAKGLPPEEFADKIAEIASSKNAINGLKYKEFASKMKTQALTQQKTQMDVQAKQHEFAQEIFNGLDVKNPDIPPEVIMRLTKEAGSDPKAIAELRQKWNATEAGPDGVLAREALKKQLVNGMKSLADRRLDEQAREKDQTNQLNLKKFEETIVKDKAAILRMEAQTAAILGAPERAAALSDAKEKRDLNRQLTTVTEESIRARRAMNNDPQVKAARESLIKAEGKRTGGLIPWGTSEEDVTKAKKAVQGAEAPYTEAIEDLNARAEGFKERLGREYLTKAGVTEQPKDTSLEKSVKPIPTKLPKATSQKDFDTQWKDLQPGESLVGPDGKTYTKKKKG